MASILKGYQQILVQARFQITSAQSSIRVAGLENPAPVDCLVKARILRIRG
jgi:hypothetical protein